VQCHCCSACANQNAPVRLQAVFSTPRKRAQALAFVQAELLGFLRARFFAPAEELGDPTKDTAEEMKERQQRVATQCLLGLQRLVALAATQPGPAQGAHASAAAAADAALRTPALAAEASDVSSASDAATSGAATPQAANGSATPQAPEVPDANASDEAASASAALRDALDDFWDDAAFWQRATGAALGPGSRAAGYGLIAALVAYLPGALDKRLDTLAPLVFAAVSDTDPGTQHALWRMVLRYTLAVPAGLHVESVRASLPRKLFALLRGGQLSERGAAAMLPLAARMLQHGLPEWAEPELLTQWAGAAAAGALAARQSNRAALCSAFAELLLYVVRKVEEKQAGAGGPLAAQELQPFLLRLQEGSAERSWLRIKPAAEAVASAIVTGAFVRSGACGQFAANVQACCSSDCVQSNCEHVMVTEGQRDTIWLHADPSARWYGAPPVTSVSLCSHRKPVPEWRHGSQSCQQPDFGAVRAQHTRCPRVCGRQRPRLLVCCCVSPRQHVRRRADRRRCW
jgi:hypothetical protein